MTTTATTGKVKVGAMDDDQLMNAFFQEYKIAKYTSKFDADANTDSLSSIAALVAMCTDSEKVLDIEDALECLFGEELGGQIINQKSHKKRFAAAFSSLAPGGKYYKLLEQKKEESRVIIRGFIELTITDVYVTPEIVAETVTVSPGAEQDTETETKTGEGETATGETVTGPKTSLVYCDYDQEKNHILIYDPKNVTKEGRVNGEAQNIISLTAFEKRSETGLGLGGNITTKGGGSSYSNTNSDGNQTSEEYEAKQGQTGGASAVNGKTDGNLGIYYDHATGYEYKIAPCKSGAAVAAANEKYANIDVSQSLMWYEQINSGVQKQISEDIWTMDTSQQHSLNRFLDNMRKMTRDQNYKSPQFTNMAEEIQLDDEEVQKQIEELYELDLTADERSTLDHAKELRQQFWECLSGTRDVFRDDFQKSSEIYHFLEIWNSILAKKQTELSEADVNVLQCCLEKLHDFVNNKEKVKKMEKLRGKWQELARKFSDTKFQSDMEAMAKRREQLSNDYEKVARNVSRMGLMCAIGGLLFIGGVIAVTLTGVGLLAEIGLLIGVGVCMAASVVCAHYSHKKMKQATKEARAAATIRKLKSGAGEARDCDRLVSDWLDGVTVFQNSSLQLTYNAHDKRALKKMKKAQSELFAELCNAFGEYKQVCQDSMQQLKDIHNRIK